MGTFDFTPQTYKLTAEMDDGVRVWMDEELVIDNWNDGYSVDQVINYAGSDTRIVIEYFENVGDATAVSRNHSRG